MRWLINLFKPKDWQVVFHKSGSWTVKREWVGEYPWTSHKWEEEWPCHYTIEYSKSRDRYKGEAYGHRYEEHSLYQDYIAKMNELTGIKI